MLHEIGEKDFCRQYVADAVPRETDVVLVFGDGAVLFCGESLARLKDVELENPEVLRYLFSISGVKFFWSEEMLPEEGALLMRVCGRCGAFCRGGWRLVG